MASLETTDIFKGAFYLCMGSDLTGIQIRNTGKQIATFIFSGPDLHRHDQAYAGGHAQVNPVQLRTALNHLRDILFERLRNHQTTSECEGPASRKRYAVASGYATALRRDKRRYENDKKGAHRVYQNHC